MAFSEEKLRLFKGQFVGDELVMRGNCLYIEGVFKLLVISKEEIDVKRRKRIVKVVGEGLEVFAYGKGFVGIVGDVMKIEVVK